MADATESATAPGKIEPGESPEASELMSGMFGLVREHLRSKLRG
jgi:hypothetical protein